MAQATVAHFGGCPKTPLFRRLQMTDSVRRNFHDFVCPQTVILGNDFVLNSPNEINQLRIEEGAGFWAARTLLGGSQNCFHQ
jgi:hypothetical protein